MTELFLVDGYNLMHRGYGPLRGDLESGRRALEKRLARFLQRRPGARILIVYDGAEGVNPTAVSGRSAPVHERLARVYSRAPESADDLILRESARLASGARLTVVSSDRKDILRNLRRDLKALSSEDFMMLVEDTLDSTAPSAGSSEIAPAGRTGPEKPETVSASELDEWLAIFSDVPDSLDEAEPAPEAPRPDHVQESQGEKPSIRSPEELAEWMRAFGVNPAGEDEERESE